VTPTNRRVAAPKIPRDRLAPDEAALASGPAARDGSDSQEGPAGAEGSGAPRRFARLISALRTGLGVILVVSSAVGVAWAARRHVMTSPRFGVTEVRVSGNAQRPADALVAESGITVGANAFSLDLDAARERLLADPWIAEATLSRQLPGTILVQIVERKATGLVALGDTMLVTPNGEPFKKLEPGDPTELPVVTGLRAENLSDDREGTMRTIRRAIELGAEYEHGTLARRAPLEEVHVEPDGTFSLVVGRNGVELVLGPPPFRRKLDQAARVAAELDRRGAKADAILLDNDGRPDRVVVRMR
jgi:cell division protein FtsQ